MIDQHECLSFMLWRVPEMREPWNAFKAKNPAKKLRSACRFFTELTDFVTPLLGQPWTKLLTRVFDAVEVVMVEGDSSVSEAAATCFLENLQNAAAAGRLSAEFRKHLGPKSLEFCDAWESFCNERSKSSREKA
jgi:hypothetical protein